jgi:hypothetical protein
VSHRWRLIQWVAGIVVATTTALVVAPGHRSVSLGAGVMALLAVLLVEMRSVAYRLSRSSGTAWEQVRRTSEPKPERPADLEGIERRFGWGEYSVGDFNYRVRPTLRRLAEHRLRESHRVAVEDEEARRYVTPELWDYVIAKQPPEDPRVMRTADIARMVDEIEGL